jgi:hypothetical protein
MLDVSFVPPMGCYVFAIFVINIADIFIEVEMQYFRASTIKK